MIMVLVEEVAGKLQLRAAAAAEDPAAGESHSAVAPSLPHLPHHCPRRWSHRGSRAPSWSSMRRRYWKKVKLN